MIDRGRFLDALRFMSIIPVPSSVSAQQPDWLSRGVKYFPAGRHQHRPRIGRRCGWLAGAIWGPVIAAILAVATSIVMTGALHEDGLADTADGFGGGWTIERRLAIMKDSRIGAYGALALAFGIALRVAALAQWPLWTGVATLIAVHAAARVTPAFVLSRMLYQGDVATMKVAYQDSPIRSEEFRFALLIVIVALLPLAFISFTAVVSGLLLGSALAAALATWSRRLIGGYTGDVLGAIEQMFEIGFLLGVAAVIR